MSIQGSIILKDVKLWWPFLAKKNELAEKYTVDISQLSKAHIKAIKKLGLSERVRTKEDDRDMFMTCKSNFPPKVMDNNKVDVDPLNVGNGTVADVKVQAYDGKYPGLFAGIAAIKITDLVEYDRNSNDFDDDNDDEDVTSGLFDDDME